MGISYPLRTVGRNGKRWEGKQLCPKTRG